MSSYTTGLGIMNLDGSDFSDLCLLDVEEANEISKESTWMAERLT